MPGHTALETLVGELTVAELASKSGRSVEDIVGWAMTGAGAGRSATSGRTAAPRAAVSNGRRKGVDTRSAKGRAAYEADVLQLVEAAKVPISAPEIRAKAGGTPQQARAALNRLIEAGKITYQGRARATRYSAA